MRLRVRLIVGGLAASAFAYGVTAGQGALGQSRGDPNASAAYVPVLGPLLWLGRAGFAPAACGSGGCARSVLDGFVVVFEVVAAMLSALVQLGGLVLTTVGLALREPRPEPATLPRVAIVPVVTPNGGALVMAVPF